MEVIRLVSKQPLIQKPLLDLIGQECYIILFDELDFSHKACLKVLASKGLSLGLTFGGGIVKLPQIISILNAKSARGLSLSSYLLDTASLLIYVAYNLRHNFPLLTFGENILLLGQNVVIICLIMAYGSVQARTSTPPVLPIVAFLVTTGFASYAFMQEGLIPHSALQTLMAAAVPLSLASKIPQIVSNVRAGSVGQLSSFLVFASFVGCAARVFTTMQETGDKIMLLGFVLQTLLNGILALQIMVYGSKPPLKEKPISSAPIAIDSQRAPAAEKAYPPRPYSPAGTPAQQRSVSKNWVRKAD